MNKSQKFFKINNDVWCGDNLILILIVTYILCLYFLIAEAEGRAEGSECSGVDTSALCSSGPCHWGKSWTGWSAKACHECDLAPAQPWHLHPTRFQSACQWNWPLEVTWRLLEHTRVRQHSTVIDYCRTVLQQRSLMQKHLTHNFPIFNKLFLSRSRRAILKLYGRENLRIVNNFIF